MSNVTITRATIGRSATMKCVAKNLVGQKTVRDKKYRQVTPVKVFGSTFITENKKRKILEMCCGYFTCRNERQRVVIVCPQIEYAPLNCKLMGNRTQMLQIARFSNANRQPTSIYTFMVTMPWWFGTRSCPRKK